MRICGICTVWIRRFLVKSIELLRTSTYKFKLGTFADMDDLLAKKVVPLTWKTQNSCLE